MRRGLVLLSTAIVAAALFTVLLLTPAATTTNRLDCTDTITISYMGSTTAFGVPPNEQTETTYSSFTTTTNATGTVGQVVSTTLQTPGLTGGTITVQSCTYTD